MIELAKLTGEIEGHRFQCQMQTGETLFAPFVMQGTDVTMPSQDWVDANKDKFLVVVGFLGDQLYDPLILGFYPVKGADSNEYNTTDRLFKMFVKLIDQLLKAKVNTQIGPQPFMGDTIQVFNDIKSELDEITKLMGELKVE